VTDRDLVRRCAVIGSPVDHSLSPALHSAAYTYLGLDWTYDRYEVTEADLVAFLDGLDGRWRGLSVTMPLKEAALRCVDDVAPMAATVSAVNTILFDEEGRRFGDNTDVPGMVAALEERWDGRPAYGAVIGGGATARSALGALSALTDRVEVFVRTPQRAERLMQAATDLHLTCRVRDWAEREDALTAPVVISATPAGATDDLATRLQSSPGVLFDVVYSPWPTPLASAWADSGGTVVSGFDLLVHQAVLQVAAMTGRDVSVSLLRAAVTSELARSTR
jgi:shikimate dehydrogenase